MMRKKTRSRLCLFAGVALLTLGALDFVLARNFFSADSFAARAAASLNDPGVASFAAESLTDAITAASPDLIALRPLLRGTAQGLVATRPFQAVVEQTARRAHEALFAEQTQQLMLSFPDLEVLLRSALATASPEVAAKLPSKLTQMVGTLGSRRTGETLVAVSRLKQQLRWLGPMLFTFGAGLLVLGVWLAADRRRALLDGGISLLAAGVVLILAVPVVAFLLRFAIAAPLPLGFAQGLARAYLGDLRAWGIFYLGFGTLCAAGATSLLEAVNPLDALQRAGRYLILPPRGRTHRLLWASTLLLLGIAAVAFPREILTGVMLLAGLLAAYAGVREFFRLFLETMAHLPLVEKQPERTIWNLRLALLAALGLALGAAWFLFRNPAEVPAARSTPVCNGDASLCAKRLDEVTFAAAHNAMSNQSIPDWLFPHHQAGIPRQLEDGIRALLIDIHFGLPGASRVKTDLDREPMSDKMKKAVGEEGYAAAMRIRNRLIGVDEGRPGLYFCHGFCELGAYPVEPVLRDIRSFLASHPEEVLLLVIEDYVAPRELAAAFNESGLDSLVYS
nr:hypothetical protein [Bryobacter sp.]